ncbi:MAG: OmpA family protein [Verrucomicrobiales bacterium]|nr:OmpA family protein [Verrucomicrobiales bacterium]
MKRTYFCQLIALSLVLSTAFLGCRKKPGTITPIPGRTGARIPNGSAPNPPAQGTERGPAIPADGGTTRLQQPNPGQTELGGRFNPANYNEDRDQFREQTVYFDYDKSTIKANEQGKIQAVASYLQNESRTMLNVEGHCDERGTAEYNRSLGERRALAIREYLISLGIIGERINTISFGEDKPVELGHDEIAWEKNRRGEFILLRPKQ